MSQTDASRRVIDFRYAPPVGWTAICRPDDPHKTLVSEKGALLYGFQNRTFRSWTFRRVYEFRLRSALGVQSRSQQTESARVPVVVTTIEYPKGTLTLRAFGHADVQGRRTDVVLWDVAVRPDVDEFLVTVEVDAYEQGVVFTGQSYAPAHVIFAAAPENDLPPADFDTVQSTVLVEDPAAPAPGPVAFVSYPQQLRATHPEGFRPCSAMGTIPTILKGGERARGAFIFPVDHEDVSSLSLEWAEQALSETRTFWNELPLMALPFLVPDGAVMDMVTASARNILQAREIKEGLPEFQVGATIYRGLWVVDGHFLLEAAQYLGYADDAFRGLDALLRRVRDDGSITQMPFHSKETGISLATLVRQCELAGREDHLLDMWPVIQRAVDYIVSLRAEAAALPHDHPGYRLIPESFADGGVGGKRGEYTTVFWLLFGLRAMSEAAERLGKGDDAGRFRQLHDELMADFLRCYERDKRSLPGGISYLPQWMAVSGDDHWIPNLPGTPPRDRHLQPQSATWAFNQGIYPGEIFDVNDPIVQNHLALLDAVDDAEGMPAETGWLPYRANWNYDASFAAHVWLFAGRPGKAVDYLYAFANHATPTRVWREEHSERGSDNAELCGDMPHNWASAEFIRLVRHLVVLERGQQLLLLPGVPAEWLRPGSEIRLERTPTRYGPVTLSLTVAMDGTFEGFVARDMGWQRQPEAVRLLLPGAATIALGGVSVDIDAAGGVTLPAASHVDFAGTFAQ